MVYDMAQKILVADDEEGIVLLLKDYFELQGYEVITAGALVGILLFVPVFLPEQDRDLWDVIKARYTKITTVYLTRILISFVFSSLLTLLFLLVMKAGNCEMEPAKYYFGTMAEVIAFGGLGIFAYAVSGNLIAGYMIPSDTMRQA